MSLAEKASRWSRLILGRFTRALNLKSSEEASPYIFSLRLPGFKYDDFDRAGFVNIAKINRTMESTRVHKSERNLFPGKGSSSFFMFGTHIQVSEQLYKKAATEYPMKCLVGVGSVGQSSADLVHAFVEEDTGTVLAERISRVVHIDPATRKSTPMPEEVIASARSRFGNSEQLRLPRFNVPSSIPEKHFVHELAVRFADLDLLFHCNQGAYLVFCLECAARAANAGFYSNIQTDVCFYPAKSAFGIHVGETFAGDVLKVLTWEDETDPMLVYFAIRKAEKDVYYGKVEFYKREIFDEL